MCAALLFLTLGCDGTAETPNNPDPTATGKTPEKETSLTSTVNLAFTDRDP